MTSETTDPPRRIGFLLIDGYALMSTAAAVEPLRAANLLSRNTLYRLDFLSVDTPCVAASIGSAFKTTPIAAAGIGYDLIFVVAGGNPLSFRDTRVRTWLHQLDRHGVPLGGISGGAAILAWAGVLDNRRFTVHWQHYDALRELSPDYLMERRLFVIDRDRFTCAGGMAPLDMMHAMIAADYGAELANLISDWFIHTGIRQAEDPQRMGTAERYGIFHPALLAMVGLMNDHIGDPLTLRQLSRLCGISVRQLERVAKRQLGMSVMQFYRKLRLSKADELLQQTALSIIEIGVVTGFPNPAHFARVFREEFDASPSERRNGA